MKSFVLAIAATAILSLSAHAQNSLVREPEAKSGQPVAGPPQVSDPRTTTGQAPVAIPKLGNPYGAKGGATGSVNPDRVPQGTPGGNPPEK
jgi:hypothetical protein